MVELAIILGIVIFFMVITMLVQLEDLIEYERKMNKIIEFITNHKELDIYTYNTFGKDLLDIILGDYYDNKKNNRK